MKKEVITKIDPKSPVSEVFRTLRTNIQYINKTSGAQTILVTSTIQGEGKSFTAANLAVTFAQANKNVVIVDSDMRRPRQHTIFDVNMYPGLSNYLSGININKNSGEVKLRECISETKIDNLYILPAGNIPPNPSELLQSERLLKMINELKRVFDVIIFDGAPCLLVTDATLVSRSVDSTILVVSQGKTKSDDLKDAKRRIEHVGGHIAGVVLNRVKVSSKKYDDRYYYYSSTSDYPSTRTRRHSHRFEDEDSRDDDYHEGREERIENNLLESKKTFESRDTSEVKEKFELRKDSFETKNNQNATKNALNINFEEPPKGVNSVPVTSEKAKEILEQLNRFKENNK